MKTTVIVCTYNRCDCLRAALESVAASVVSPPDEWEVLIVDNNSNDGTKAVAEEFCRRYPGRFRYAFESRPGKSYALNTGVREARGRFLAFMDDDVRVESTWLQNLTAAMEDGPWSGAGGRTLPAKMVPLPPWLGFDHPFGMGGILCAYFNLGDEPRELDEAPYGTNMAFRKEVFEKYGGFRIDLGPRPGSQIRNEDTEFGRRLLAAGERLRYAPFAVVYHPIPENRIRKDFFLAWYFDLGRANVREIGRRPDIWGIPRPFLTMLKAVIVTVPARILRWLFAVNPRRRFYWKGRTWQAAGEIAEIYNSWFSKKARAGRENQPRDQELSPGVSPADRKIQ
jgi:glycosyltransferase involved in cell wall biosynthesis